MPEQKPSVGRIVHFYPAQHDGTARANSNAQKGNFPIAAIVTQVFETHSYVNLRLFTDSEQTPDQRTSVAYYGDEPPGSEVDLQVGVWVWPPRV